MMTELNENPLLSIVVPVYNGEAYLHELLDSILDSVCPGLEVLLVDNGSTDQSGRICQEYEKKDRRVRYMEIEERGIVAARNRGMSVANGEYLCFCDQDDEVAADTYRELMEKIKTEEAQIGLFSVGRLIDGRKSLYESLTDGCYQKDEILKALLYPILFCGYEYPFSGRDNYLYGTVWKCIFRRDFLRDYQMRFRRFVDYEDDWLFVTEALCHADTVVSVGSVGYYWRVNTDSRSHQKKYLSGIGGRFEQLDQHVWNYLESRIPDRDILEQYRKVRMFEHYVDVFKKEPVFGPDRKRYQREAEEYLRRTGYRKQLGCGRYIQRHAYRKQMICRSLRLIGIRGTFLLSRLLTAGETAMERIPWLVEWERKKKMLFRTIQRFDQS